MALRLHHHNFLSFSSSKCCLSKYQCGSANGGIKVLNLHCQLLSEWGSSRRRCLMPHALLWNSDHGLVAYRKYYLKFSMPRRRVNYLLFASASDDGGAVNESPQSSTSTELETIRVKLNSSLVDVDFYDGLLQSLYDATRVFELPINEHNSLLRVTWFSKAWLGVDQNAWVKDLSYQDLKKVEEAMLILENLLQELYVSSTSSGKEHLNVCSDLEKIRKVKKEAEFLEASFRAKADSLPQGVNVGQSHTPVSETDEYIKRKNRKNATTNRSKRYVGKPRKLWSNFIRFVTRKPDLDSNVDASENYIEFSTPNKCMTVLESSEINRFEHLRNELIVLEKQVQRNSYISENEEELVVMDKGARYRDDVGVVQMVQVLKKRNIIEKSLGKLKEIGTDIWQGTQLLAIDAAAAMGLLRSALIGDELTEKEKKTLKRTLTDMASVVPIGVLMLLPVTAVGHAAMLAAIKRYVPALIPSTYTPERLDLLRQLEKMKQMIIDDVESDEEVDVDVDKDARSRSNAVYVQLAKLSFFVVVEMNVGSSKNGKC